MRATRTESRSVRFPDSQRRRAVRVGTLQLKLTHDLVECIERAAEPGTSGEFVRHVSVEAMGTGCASVLQPASGHGRQGNGLSSLAHVTNCAVSASQLEKDRPNLARN